MARPPFVKNLAELPREASRIRGTSETLGLVAQLSCGLRAVRVEHEILPPHTRSSSPHAHTTREEVVFVLEGTPDVWLDGELYTLRPGDAVSFAASTGISHALINNSAQQAVLLVVATTPEDDRCFYPFNPTAGQCPPELAAMWKARPLGEQSASPRLAAEGVERANPYAQTRQSQHPGNER